MRVQPVVKVWLHSTGDASPPAALLLACYDVFKQSLALVNVARMLRPGGFLLSNNVLPGRSGTPIKAAGKSSAVYTDRPDDRDEVVWYQRH